MGVLRFAGCLVALVGTAVCSAAPMATQTDRQPAPRITSSSPQVRLTLTPRPNAAAPLTLRVTAIKNPDQIPISLHVSLAPCSASGTWAPERVAVLGVFPANQPGNYAVSVDGAAGRLRSQGITDLKGVCLQVVARHTRGGDLGRSLDVTFDQPQWQVEK